MAIPSKTIPQLPAFTINLSGTELMEISSGGVSKRITARQLVLPIDSLITVSGMGGSLPGSRQLTAGIGIAFVDGGAGSTLEVNATGAVAGPANPTAQVGLAPVNGAAVTYMRSDAAPPLDQGIAPTWTAQHQFSLAGTLAAPTIYLTSTRPVLGLNETDAAADNRRWTIEAQAEQLVLRAVNDAGAASSSFLTVDRTGTVVDSIALASTAFTWNASQVLTQANAFANPTASIGLASVNGVATTAMRSDAAPPLDQGIAPTWTGVHIFSNTTTHNGTAGFTAQATFSLSGATNSALFASSTQPQIDWNETDGAADNRRWRIEVNGEQQLFRVVNDANSAAVTWMAIDRTANTVDTIALTSTALTWNGNPLLSTATAFANPTASLGLAAVNGVATTAMRSDAAPALSVAIAPTWTGQHTFSNAVTLFSNNAPLIRMTDADGAADAKTWQWDLSTANQLKLTTVTDAIGAGNTVLTFARTGTTIDTVTVPTARVISTAVYATLKPQFQISAAVPMFEWLESDAAANNQKWQIAANGEQFLISAANDADTVSSPAMVIDRTGATVDSVTFPATVIGTKSASTALDGAILLSSAVPIISWNETDAAASNKVWALLANSEQFRGLAYNDAGSSSNDWITVDRTGTTIDRVAFPTQGNGAFVVGGTTGTAGANATAEFLGGASANALAGEVTTSANSVMRFFNTATAGDNVFAEFGTEAAYTARGSIDYNRAGGLTRYNTTSDRRLKTNVVDAGDAGLILDAVRVRAFDWKGSDAHLDFWLVAQELYEVFPHAVSKGDDAPELTEDGKQWALDPTQLVPLLIKEVQSLRSRVGTLEKKVKLN